MTLKRQAMIYKYMVASVPVPPHLLSPPNFINFGSNGLGSRLRSGGSNLESGRCKRTDGKKWRCSRDAAPGQKYCDRHLHRGRLRSRKHVELLPIDNVNVINLHLNAENYKKTRLVTMTELSASGFPSNRAGSSWQLAGAISEPYCQNHASVIKSEKKTCDSDSPFILPYNQPRALWFSRAVAGKMTGLVQVVVMLIFHSGQLAICRTAPNLDEQITMIKLQSSQCKHHRTTHPQLPT